MKNRHSVRKALCGCAALGLCASLVQPWASSAKETELPDLKISFDKPVSESQLSGLDGRGEEQNRWQQLSLPIGNSRLGATVYGEVGKERLVYNDKTLWNGGPSDSRPDYNGGNKQTASNGQSMADYVESTRQAFLAGDNSASSMCSQIVGEINGYGAYQNFGDIYIDFDREKEIDPDAGIEKIDDRDERIVYSSGWNNYAQGSWYGGSEKYSYTDGASFTVDFEGTGIRMIGVQYSEMGVCDVYIDDMETPVLSDVNMYSSSKKEGVPLFEVEGLENGIHTLKFVNKASSGRTKVSYDRLEVILASDNEIVDLNPSNASQTGVRYSSDWGMWDRKANGESDAADWVNQDEMFCQNPNSSTRVEYTFTGTGIALYGAKHSPLGTLTWSIDGEQTGDVDCYAPSMKRQELFSVQNLEEGTHTVVITSKDNTKLSLDNFVIYNGEPAEAPEVHTPYTNYERWLSVDDALAGVEFDRDNTHYSREYFASNPDGVMAIHLQAEGEKTLDFDLSFPISQPGNASLGKTVQTETSDDGMLSVAGIMNDNQMKFAGALKVETDQGTVEAGQNKLAVNGAREAVIYVSSATDYKNEYPSYRTGQTDAQVLQSVTEKLDAAAAKGYDLVLADHLADYHNLYDRVSLDLGQSDPGMSTPDLLSGYKAGTLSASSSRYLEVLTFQYGRYLEIASSRAGDDLPSNLQGIWSIYTGDYNAVPWASDFHMNVNLQMNYWPSYNTSLAECALPMIEYIDSLREPGRVTASTYFGIDNSNGQQNGFSAHTQNTPFGWTCPGWSFSWGWSPAAVPWMIQNVYEYYEYTRDVDFLRETIFPIMEEEARLYEQILTPFTYDNGVTRLVTVPAYSPEHGPYTAGNAYENELVWQLFNDCIEAAEALNADQPGSVDAAKIAQWQEILDQLLPVEIGASGQIKEWYNETTLGSVSGSERRHRHLSHLLGLYPGDLINADTPEYLEAAKVSLNDRGDQSTGWAMAQRINSWARLKDGERCMSLIQTLFKNGMFPNLWDAHPPYQIDGNFGYTAAVAEMLMQSNASSIELLPALPEAWNTGSVSGITARGNFVIDASWKEGSVTKAVITSNAGGECRLDADGLANVQIVDDRGNRVASSEEEGTIVFETEKGRTYTLDSENQKQPDVQDADKTLLAWAVDYALAAREEGALEGVNELAAEEFEEALTEAQSILSDASASQSSVDASWKRLTRAIHMLSFRTDKTALEALVAKCDAINPDEFNPDPAVLEEFENALAHAKEVLEDPAALTDQSIAEAIARLEAAAAALRESEAVDTTLLAWLVSQTENTDLDLYTPASAEGFSAALESAKAQLADPQSQQAVDQALNTLHDAWMNLRRKPDEALLQQLRDFLQTAPAFELYGDAGLESRRSDLMERSSALLADPNAESGQVQQLIQEIRSFTEEVNALKAPAADKAAVTNPSSVKSVSTSTQTDASVWIWVLVIAAAAAIGGGIWYFKKNKKSDNK